MTTSRLALAACACAALICSTAAQASANGYAQLGNIGFTLTDLDPDDGIAPSFTLSADLGGTTVNGAGTYIFVPASAAPPFNLATLDQANVAFGAAETPLVRRVTLADGSSIVSAATGDTYRTGLQLGPGLTDEGAYLSSAGLASGSVVDEAYAGSGRAPTGSITGVLSANTQLVISADLQIHLSASFDCFQCLAESHVLGGRIVLQAGEGNFFGTGGKQEADHFLAFSDLHVPGVDPDHPDYNEGFAGQISLGYDNSSADGVSIRLLAGTIASGRWEAGPAGPAPEPGTYALLGVGLAAAGWQARRRKPARA